MMKGKQSPEQEGSDQLCSKGETMSDKPPDIRSLKTAALTGGKTRLRKSPKHKRSFILPSFVLRGSNFSVRHFAHLGKKNSVARPALVFIHAQRCYLENVRHRPQSSLASPVGSAWEQSSKGVVLECQGHGTSLTYFLCPPLRLFILQFTQ